MAGGSTVLQHDFIQVKARLATQTRHAVIEQIILATEGDFEVSETPHFAPVHQTIEDHWNLSKIFMSKIHTKLELLDNKPMLATHDSMMKLINNFLSLQILDDVSAQEPIQLVVDFYL